MSRSLVRAVVVVADTDGHAILVENASINVYRPGTTDQPVMWTLPAGGSSVTNPVLTDDTGAVEMWLDETEDPVVTMLISDNSGAAVRAGTAEQIAFDTYDVEVRGSAQVIVEGGDAEDGGLSMRDYCTPGTDATVGIRACIADAIAGGYSHVKPEFSIIPYEISGKILWGEMEHRGFGDQTTKYLCTTEEAAFWFGDYDNGYQGSETRDFTIDAGNIAIAPFVVGVKVQWTLSRVSILNVASAGDWEEGAAAWFIGTQNSTIVELLTQGGSVAVRMDGSANTNVFLRCEFNLPTHTMFDFCSITSVPGLFPYTGWNTFYTCILEYNTNDMTRMILHRSGVANLLDNCVIYITDGGTSDADVCIEATDEYSLGIGASTLRLRGCTIGCTPVSTTKIACKATWPASIQVEDGNAFVGWDIGLQGYIRLSGQQTFFQINTAAIDETTGFPLIPAGEVIWQTNVRRPGAGSVVEATYVDGDDFPRSYRTASGALGIGDGTANPVQFFHRVDAITWRLTGAGLAVDGAAVAAFGSAYQVALGNVFGFAGMVLGPLNDTIVYRAGAGIVGLGKLAVGNAVAATTPGPVTKKVEVFDAAGASLGFVAVHSSIT